MENNIEKSQNQLSKMQYAVNSTSTGREISQSVILNLGEQIPIIGLIISEGKDIADTLSARNFSVEILNILQNTLNEINNLKDRVDALTSSKRIVLAQVIYHTSAAYDDTISTDKKNILANLIHDNLNNMENLNINRQEIYLSLIQQVPTYSLHFLMDMHKRFGKSMISQFGEQVNKDDSNSKKWLDFKKIWLKNHADSEAFDIEIEMVIEPLILHGLLKESDLAVLGGTRHQYAITNLGSHFVHYITE